MIFSRVRVKENGRHSRVLFDLVRNNLYSSHQLLWKLFEDDAEASRDFLFRQEFEDEQVTSAGSPRGLPIFYLVSRRMPLGESELFEVESKTYDPCLLPGMRLQFKLRANPVISISRERDQTGIKPRGGKHDILMHAKREASRNGITDRAEIDRHIENAAQDWLVARGDQYGFKVEGADKKSLLVTTSYRQHVLYKRSAQNIRFSSVDFTGILSISDPHVFQKAIFEGLGRSKSFGCGLMMIRRT